MFLNGGIAAEGTGPFLADFFGNDIDHAAERVGTVQGRHRAAHYLNPLDGVHRDPVQIEIVMAEDGVTRVDAFAIDQDQRIAAIQTADADTLAVIPFVGELNARHIAQHVLQVLHRLTLQVLLGDHADTGGGIFDALFSRRGGDNQRFVIICGQRRKCQCYDGRAQSRPGKRV